MAMTPVMATTGLHISPAELDRIRLLATEAGSTQSRIVRAAITLATAADRGLLRAALARLEPTRGHGVQSGVFITLSEFEALDQAAAAAGTSRSRLARAALVLFADLSRAEREQMVRQLPPDGRLRQEFAA